MTGRGHSHVAGSIRYHHIRAKFPALMVKSCHASVLCGCGCDGFKPESAAAASGGQVLPVLHTGIAVKGIGAYDDEVAAALYTDGKIYEAVSFRNITTGEDGIFKDIPKEAA